VSGNHWTVFNGAGAVVADNMPLDVVRAYLTPGRLARGWHAAFVFVARTVEDLDEWARPTENDYP
jgi:hypothetical protein